MRKIFSTSMPWLLGAVVTGAAIMNRVSSMAPVVIACGFLVFLAALLEAFLRKRPACPRE